MKRCIIFFRGDHFYPTEYPANYSDWQAEADRNPGTTKIMERRDRQAVVAALQREEE